MGALNGLVNQPSADARPQFQQFSAALDQLAASAKRTGRNVHRMWQNRAAYFQVWDREIADIKDEDIHNRSQARKAEVSTQFYEATQQSDAAQKGLRPLVACLQDIRTALSADLTRHGLLSLQPSVNLANDNAREVLAQAATKLDALSAPMASFRVREAQRPRGNVTSK